ncbi:MAG: hypothetical protein AVDCRST_MAG69-1683, partial [uncultured Solirubrobacteraceae bacterium]
PGHRHRRSRALRRGTGCCPGRRARGVPGSAGAGDPSVPGLPGRPRSPRSQARTLTAQAEVDAQLPGITGRRRREM